MKKRIKTIIEERNGLRDSLKKAGFDERKHYSLRTFLETDPNGGRNVSTDVKVKEEVYNEDHKKIFDAITDFHEPRTGRMVEDMEAHNTFSISSGIEEDEYQELFPNQELSDNGDLEDLIKNYIGEKKKGKKNIVSDEPTEKTEKSQTKSQSTASKEKTQTSQEQSSPAEEAVVLEPSKISACGETSKRKKTVVECLSETASDRQVQKQSLCFAAAATIATGLFLAVKEFQNTPRLEGESGINKAKRVLSQTFKRPSTYFKMFGAGLCGTLACYGYHAGKKMSE